MSSCIRIWVKKALKLTVFRGLRPRAREQNENDGEGGERGDARGKGSRGGEDRAEQEGRGGQGMMMA